MKVLVTGVYGFIGFSTAKRLLEMGHEVVGVERISNSVSEKNERIRLLKDQPGFSVCDLDMSDFNATKNTLMKLDFDLVLHLAGQYSKPYSEETMIRFVDGNVRTWVHLMHIAQLKKIPRVVYASSTHVPLTGYPTNMYGATLAFRDIASKTYNAMGVKTVAIRYSTTYGPYMRDDSPPAQIMKKIHKKKQIDLESGAFGGSYAWVNIADAVEITIRALFNDLDTDHVQITALANEAPQNLGTCIDLVEKFSGLKAVTKGVRPSLPEPKIPQAQLDLIKDTFGFVPKVGIVEGMREYVAWYMQAAKC